MTTTSRRQKVRKAVVLINTLGAVGYLFLLLSWALCGGAIVWLAMQSSVATLPADTSLVAPSVSSGAVSLWAQLLGYGIALAMSITTIALLLTLPYLVGKWCAQAMRWLMKELHIGLSRRHLFLAKSVVAVVPLVAFVVLELWGEPTGLVVPALHIAAIVMSIMCLSCFVLQLWIARSLVVMARDMW